MFNVNVLMSSIIFAEGCDTNWILIFNNSNIFWIIDLKNEKKIKQSKNIIIHMWSRSEKIVSEWRTLLWTAWYFRHIIILQLLQRPKPDSWYKLIEIHFQAANIKKM